ncbi:MAG: LuxR C-terminal-related transcriptional regulator [Deltaproteobacteria bacterium]|nr:LuxR C-terminal-related transcriptional regulator [Deltaproteobacteria bacterium]
MADETTTTTLIRTKLNRFPIPEGHVHRPRLLERLEQNRQRPLTLVSAPAGYGKSTLVSCWLQMCASPHAWLSLDKNDNDLHLFLSYFLAAIQTMFPHAVSETMTLVNSPTLPSLSVLAGSLVNELDLIEQDFILVLDDIHRIREKSVYKLLTELLRHPPRSMHLVLIGRRDPSLALASLRAREQVTEVRLFELRFTMEETAEFLQIAMGGKINEAQTATLAEKTEGWVTGLRLACLSMLYRSDLDPKLLEPHVDAQFVMEYLFTEVFSLQPPEISQYLMGTAILDRFCGPLCEAVCAPGVDSSRRELGGRDFIAWLKKEHVFLIPLDTQSRWFRYHHLFQRLLGNQLKRHCSTEEINVLHSRASGWFAEEGLIEEALEHALAAGDIPTAIQLVAQHGHQLMDDQQWSRLERWLDMLPPDSVEENPEMLLLRLWSNHMRTAGFDVSALATQLEKIENLISTPPPNGSVKVEQIRSHCDALRSFQHYMGADGEVALKHARSACKNIPIHHKRARLRAHIFQVASYHMVGDLETGLSHYYNEVQENPNLSKGDQAMYLANLCFMYWIDADLISMLQTSENTLKIAMDHRISEAIAFSLYFTGIACYHQNNLQSAEEKLASMVKDFYMYMQVIHTHGSFCLSLIYQAQGHPDKARERNRKMMEYAVDTGNQVVLRTTQAFEAELALRQGRLSEASNWAERFQPKSFLPPFAFYTPQLTLVKILLAQDTTDSRRQAADLLDQLHDFLASIHYKKSLIEVLALQGLLHDTLGDASVAQEKIAKALALAEPGGFIRVFVDLGPQMADLLKRLHEQNVAVDHIEKLLAAFSYDEQVPVQEVSKSQASLALAASPQFLEDPLTNRELDVLELLTQRLSNKEIAEKLFVSSETVKGHLKNMYPKLQVSNRREAVEKAKALGILSRR